MLADIAVVFADDNFEIDRCNVLMQARNDH